ncbi:MULTISPECIES: hypothetical protein [Lactobacillus]|uniref:Uncharacterized protein n=1 Tax=Lactobacillus xujianguonis TaxID=2495899 RepID=A0A437SW06_9LACO|nr:MULTISPECIES: hypothetical protein [Lactobacillus]RVU71017.1 hypothetical protein EJK17_04745 [Lactobacillus xujianguonis]RVU73913.1 hypothetical protein EJK20_05565 [Lactobacillus xujianguonis]
MERYYRTHLGAYHKLKQDLVGKNQGPIKLAKKGHYWLIFPRYALELPAYRLAVSNNSSRAKLSVNDQAYEKTIKVLPGEYKVAAKADYLGQSAQT